jgi:hypothetical protein
MLAGVLSSCTSARSSLGTSDSSCFLDLPTASQAVGGHGHFVGIHLFSVSQLGKLAPNLMDHITDIQAAKATHVCVAAYEGQFTSANVMKPLGKSSGRLAVVVVDASNQKLIGTDIITRAPLHFGHSHVG